MTSSFLHRTCGPERGTWDLGRPRPAGPHPTPDADPGLSLSHGGYTIPDRLQYSRLAIHTSAVYTILGGLYNSRVASLQFSGGYTTLDLPYHARPAMQFSTGYAIIYRRASVPRARVPRANVPRASVQRVNAWNNCVTHLIPPTGHRKLHTNYIYSTSKLHTNYIYRVGLYM